jgi:hypothetical protein
MRRCIVNHAVRCIEVLLKSFVGAAPVHCTGELNDAQNLFMKEALCNLDRPAAYSVADY